MITPFGTFGAPPDVVAWCALTAAFASYFAWRSSRVVNAATRRPLLCVALLSMTAVLLSCGYVAYYLRGGPRIIDATSYFLEARTFANGSFTFSVPVPSGSFRGRFLLTAPSPERLGVIFPPGYPLILAAGFLAHAPMAIGPLIGGLIVATTFFLARRLFDARTALVAAALSVVSAALRYHTADTMSHGWAALLGATALLAAAAPSPFAPCAAGLSCGWLIATRPVTGAVFALANLWLVTVQASDVRARFGGWLLGIVPGVLLLLLHQRALTGHWFSSPQLAYYALADGPPGCFRYGFGASVGCLGEHGDFVRHNLKNGYGFIAAAGTTLRRLKMHLLDAGNCEPFALAIVGAAFVGWQKSSARLLALVVFGVIAAYVPFYFDGNYPGGGARFYADVLPLEHILLGSVISHWRIERFALPLALTGFATHAVFEHRQLRDREGGRPMFEQRVLEAAGVRRGIVFVDTDHGFNLGYAPGVDAEHGILVARLHRDAHDWTLYTLVGKPLAYTYRFSLSGGAKPSLSPYTPTPSSRFEAEAEWPPIAIAGGWVRREYVPCASQGAGVAVEAVRAETSLTMEVTAPRPGLYDIAVGWLGHAPKGAYLTAGSSGDTGLLPTASTGDCGATITAPVPLRQGRQALRFRMPPGPALDFVELGQTPTR